VTSSRALSAQVRSYVPVVTARIQVENQFPTVKTATEWEAKMQAFLKAVDLLREQRASVLEAYEERACTAILCESSPSMFGSQIASCFRGACYEVLSVIDSPESASLLEELAESGGVLSEEANHLLVQRRAGRASAVIFAPDYL
jgi:hypothetical protein